MKGQIRFLLITILGLIFFISSSSFASSMSVRIGIHRELDSNFKEKQIFQSQQNTEPLDLVEIGKNYYDSGQFTAAIKILQQAEEIYQMRKDFLKQSQVLSFISLGYQKLGKIREAEIAIKKSFSLLEGLPNKKNNQIINQLRAQVLNAEGNLQLVKGNATAALESWKNGEILYQKSGNQQGVIGSRINQVQALQTLGFYRQAYKLISDTENEIKAQPDSILKLIGRANASKIKLGAA